MRFWFLPNSLFLVVFLGMLSLVFLEKFWVWVLTELIFAVILTELINRSESLSPIVLFIMVEVSLSISLLGAFLLESSSLVLLFCVGKLGVVPLWFWVFRLFSGLDVRSIFSVMTIYKVIPLIMVCLCVGSSLVVMIVCLNSLVILYLFSSSIVLSNSLGVLVVFSTGWLLAASVGSSFALLIFFIFYLVMLCFLLFSEVGGGDLVMILFYSGLPPLGSFFSKLFVLISSGSGLGFSFVPLFFGLMILTVWVFFSTLSSKGSKLVMLLLVVGGMFV